LCYLLLNHQYPIHRERLVATFWGDDPSREGRKHLRASLWKLRKILQSAGAPPDQYLLISDDSVSFITTSPYWLDVRDFENTISNFHTLSYDELVPEQSHQLERAIDLYTGDLLESVYEDWCIYDRERLRQLYLNTMNKLMVFYSFSGDFERSLDFGRRILSKDNTIERVHRQIMSLEWIIGNRSAALSQYKLCSQILREELGVAPLEESRNLYERMLHGQVQSPAWLLNKYFFSRTKAGEAAPLPISTEDLLQKMQRLQETVEQTSAELGEIQNLMWQLLSSQANRNFAS
jgi:DNA-binding SARP family transcriptional activator